MNPGPAAEELPARPTQPLTDDTFARLNEWECRWRDRQQFLESRGYMLRPRYQPDWIPSWRVNKESAIWCEDAIRAPLREHLIDAKRISSGTMVYIKRVKTNDNESQIATMLSSDGICRDPRNHSVPVLDLFEDVEDPDVSYMVMPFLRLIDRPALDLVEEVVEFIDQILEGLIFMHECGVAHRDCTYKNLMMDASAMYPQGSHPINDVFLPDARTIARPLPRTSVPMRYYFVDYGLSVHIHPDAPSKLVLGVLGRDQEVPELSDEVPYDPFAVDIFIVGNLFRHMFFEQYSNVDFLVPLFEAMIQHDAVARPNAKEARQRWLAIRETLFAVKTRWRLRPRREPWQETVFYDLYALARISFFFRNFTMGTFVLIGAICFVRS
ncbi:uncharacterized protein B0H18DRAFT_680318 [Fomitopsis serialis]|uniref:uncharacterized protein n=1 Tax=Fomitopsis serialis TaxID=139415 RepID=UPI002008AAF5|nr:uncharacterized protein B0H18DRAFT_680318 [Neoantrodia serialis]KAH9918119.1 hypothetical protein B0H18DRAFT_680318 [Neoantrodia serialis]